MSMIVLSDKLDDMAEKPVRLSDGYPTTLDVLFQAAEGYGLRLNTRDDLFVTALAYDACVIKTDVLKVLAVIERRARGCAS